ncbi:hypothetical protein [Lysobacter sp. ESA13C]|uniref:hypothetical protein n=1 Tax=Lysobacter sp. ESA13C TaxID=2862676 RepID=UPI001CBD4295|nr:hypothetical protein [Lysobacter sp. ESA13C]
MMQAKWLWLVVLAALVGSVFVAVSDPLQRTLTGFFDQDASRSTSPSATDEHRTDNARKQAVGLTVRDEELLTRHLADQDPGAALSAPAEASVVPEDLEKLPEAERMAYLARERFGPRIAPTPSESARYNIPTARIEKQSDGRYWLITDDGPSRPNLPPGTIVERDPERR